MIKNRSSYSINNVIRFKAFFDHIIENRESYFVAADRTGLTPATLQQKISDALLYLCQEYDLIVQEEQIPSEDIKKHSQLEYLALKGMVSFKIVYKPTPGIDIVLKKLRGAKSSYKEEKKTIEAPKEVDPNWKEEVMTFVETNKGMINIEDLDLSPEDIQWVHNVLGAINCEYNVTQNEIVAAKN